MKQEKTMKGFSLNIDEISQCLDITHPFLMIDYVDKIIPGKSAHSIKKLTDDDWFFKSHMQRDPVMPGSLQIEAMLQTLVLTIYTMEGHEGWPCFEISINTKLLSKVSPGDLLDIHADLLSYKRGIAKGAAIGKVNDTTVCQGEFTIISPHAMPRPHG
jgi:3-hydroxyacyl-[acyl-carrier-protein] dehydratase|tara:strand:- start:80 stop:553 length:474 start_codon:yes stop_codon:yes gene_type:complete